MQNFSQLREIYTDLKGAGEIQSIFSDQKKKIQLDSGKEIEVSKLLENNDDIIDIVEQNRDLIIEILFADIIHLNKKKRRALNKFLKDYLSSLSIEEEQEILAKIDYYLDLYEIYNLEINNKLTNEILAEKDNYSKIEILSELLLNSSLLPNYQDQKQFNQEMLEFLPRLENSINKFLLSKKSVILPPINARRLLGYLSDLQAFNLMGSKVVKGGLIKQIAYKFSLGERASINQTNEFEFSFLINDENLLSREHFLIFLRETLHLKDSGNGKFFIYDSDELFNYAIYVGEEMYERETQTWDNFQENGLQSDEDGFLYNGFEVKVYAESKKDLETEEIFTNMCNRLPAVTERLINDIYQTYGYYNGKKEGFPEKPVIFNVMDRINVYYPGDSGVGIPEGDGEDIMKNISGGKGKEKYKFYESTDIQYSLDDLVLEDRLQEEIEELLDFYEDIDFYLSNNGDLPKGVLLYGPPGTGKTTITLILAKHSGAGVFVAEANQEDSLVGESANNIKNIVDKAKDFIDNTGNPAIIFFDEADNIFSKRGGKVKDFKEGMLSVLLQEMDGFDKKYDGKITFVFGSNRKDMLDNAVLSRIDKHLEIPLPNEEARIKILDLHIKQKMNGLRETIKMYETANIDLKYISEKLEGRSGRFIRNLVKNFHNKALRRFKKDNNFVITNDFILDSIKFTEDKGEYIEKTMGFKI